LAVFTLLAGLLLALLYAIDSETRQRLHDSLAALNLPAPPWQAPQSVIVSEKSAEVSPVLPDRDATAAGMSAEEMSSAEADARTTDSGAAVEPDETTVVAATGTVFTDSARAAGADAASRPDSASLVEVAEELVASDLPVERMGPDSLKVSLSGDGVFEFNSTSINDSTGSVLARLAGVLTARDNVRVSAIGHTDSSGEPDYNVYLSQLRAKAVVDYLIGQGLPEDRTQSEGRGDRDTQFEESTRDQPELRRRVEIYISPLRGE